MYELICWFIILSSRCLSFGDKAGKNYLVLMSSRPLGLVGYQFLVSWTGWRITLDISLSSLAPNLTIFLSSMLDFLFNLELFFYLSTLYFLKTYFFIINFSFSIFLGLLGVFSVFPSDSTSSLLAWLIFELIMFSIPYLLNPILCSKFYK